MRRCIYILLFFLIHFNVFSQNYNINSRQPIDSLLILLPGSGIESRIDILNNLAYRFAPGNFDSSIMFSTRAMRLAAQFGSQKQIGVAKYNSGNAFYFKMDFKNALLSYLSAQSILEKGLFYKEMGDVNLMLGHINFFIQRSDKAIIYYRKALACYQSGHDEKSFLAVYDAMGITIFFLKEGPIDSAQSNGHKLLEYSRKYNDRLLEAYALMVVGTFYLDEDKSPGRKQLALVYSDSALRLATALKNDELIAIINSNFAGFYDRSSPLFEFTGDLTLARTYYDKAYRSALKIRSSYLQSRIKNYLAEIDIEEGKYDEARRDLDISETRLNEPFQFSNTYIADGLNDPFHKIFQYYLIQQQRTDLYHARFNLAFIKGDFRKAVDYLQLFYSSRDTMNATLQGRQFELLIAEDEAEKQAQKLRDLEQSNELNKLKLSRTRNIFIVTGAGILLVSIILLLLFQRRKLKAEQRLVMMEQRLLRAQMNPHFIFNSLASIQNFVINENSGQATVYLSRFSQLIRNILDNSTEEYVLLEKEISTIENYLELQKVRYSGKFDYSIIVDEMIELENMLIPPMLAQPFIENAIEHGIRYKETPGNIKVRFQLKGGLIKVEVEDDGVGREKAHEIEAKQKIRHRSMAISITRDRLDILNKNLKNKIRMEIIDLKDFSGQPCGTRVEFGIPVAGR
ncbi:MAG: histidine kinase [Bacteroidetes bacterium]|nr:histidine kinase [Bacteroidota bacterium]